MAATDRLQVQYASRRALLSAARTEGAVLSLFVHGSEHVAAGAEVLLEISVEDLRFELEGRVRLQRAGGLGIIFTGERKRLASQMLATCAGTSELDLRHQVDVRCLIDLHGTKLKGALKDVSCTGAFIRAPRLAELRGHAELTIQLDPIFGFFGGSVLKARIVWVGEKKGVPGIGVRFLDGSAHVRERLRKHLPQQP